MRLALTLAATALITLPAVKQFGFGVFETISIFVGVGIFIYFAWRD